MATRANALARVARSASSLAPASARSRPATSDFSASCARVEEEIRFGDVVRRFAVAIDQLPEIGRQGEGRYIGRCRQKLLEVRGVVAFERRARILRLQALQIACLWQRRRRRRARSQCRAARGTAAYAGRSTSTDRRGGSAATVFDSSTSRVRRTEPVETVETKRRPVPASAVPDWPDGILQHHDAGDHRLRGGAVLLDIGFGIVVRPVSMITSSFGIRRSSVMVTRCRAEPIAGSWRPTTDAGRPTAYTSLITCPLDRMWTL